MLMKCWKTIVAFLLPLEKKNHSNLTEKTYAEVQRKEDVFSANDPFLNELFPLSSEVTSSWRKDPDSPRRWSHHWLPLVNLFGPKSKENSRRAAFNYHHPFSYQHYKRSQWGARCLLLPCTQKYKTCALCMHSVQEHYRAQCIFWRQYFKAENLRFPTWAACYFFFPLPFLHYLELPLAYEADFISWKNMTQKVSFSFIHSVIEQIFFWEPNTPSPVLDSGHPNNEQRTGGTCHHEVREKTSVK